MGRWRSGLAAVLVAMVAGSCTPDLTQSSAVLLVPTDETYRSQWQFEPVDGPNNFQVFVHWSASFNPDVDRSLTLVAYQVSDAAQWAGADAENDATAAALRTHASGGCNDVIEAVPEVRSCAYDVGQVTPLMITSRVVDTTTGQAMILVPGDDVPRAVGYLVGRFEEVMPAQAAHLLR